MTEITPIYTQVGHTGAQELRFWGHRVFAELLGRTTTTQLLVCDVIGRIVDSDDALVIDDIMTAMTSADPRLWPFKITRLAASYGSAACGVASTLVASHGAIFGASRFREIADVVVDLHRRAAEQRLSDDELEAMLKQGTVGFGILYGKYDVRFDSLVGQLEKRGRAERPFVRVAKQAVHVARTRMSLEPHVFVAIAAACLDMGMTPDQIGTLGMLPLFHDALANAAEGAAQRSESLQRLPHDRVAYVGHAARISVRAMKRGPR